jgi:hypothetical protein
MRRFVVLFVIVCGGVFASDPPPALADVVLAEHRGALDPLSEGFLDRGSMTGKVAVPDDGGYPAWRLQGSGGTGYYYKPLDYTAAFAEGWRLSGRVRLVSGGGYLYVSLNPAPDRPRFDVTVAASGSDAVVALLNASPALSYTVPGGATSWLVLELIYDPATERARLLVNGVERLTGYAGWMGFNESRGLMFGTAGPVAHFNVAQFKTGQGPDDVVLADFESGDLAGWTLTGDPWTVGGTTGTSPDLPIVYGSKFARSGAPNVPPGQPLSESNVGTALSPPFVVTHDTLTWYAAGWSAPSYDGASRYEILDAALVVKAQIPTPQSDPWRLLSVDLLDIGLAPGATFHFRAVDNKPQDHYAWMAFDRLAIGGTPATATLTLTSLTLKKPIVAGCKPVVGTVTLSAPAPVGGAVVTLSETLASGSVPASVTIPAGATSKTFKVTTTARSDSEAGTVSATYGGTTLTKPLTVRPMSVLSIPITPTTLVGGGISTGVVKLECKAAPGPILVEFGSTLPAVAGTTVPNVLIPVGVQTAPVTVTTSPVTKTTKPKLTATANGLTKSKTLTVTP